MNQKIVKGEKIAELGQEKENGKWPPHLLFKIVSHMQGRISDFPGVARKKDKSGFYELYPDPILILNI